MPRPSTPRPLVYGALVLVQLLFGVHYLMAKVVLREIEPAVWALIRVSAAAALMLALVPLTGRRFPREPGLYGQLALYAVFGVVINQWCFVEGLSRTTAGHSSILMVAIPVGTLLFAVLLGREQVTSRKVISFAVAVAGVLLVLRPSGLGEASLAGDLLIVTNAMSYSLFLVISKRVLDRVDTLVATALLLGFGAIGMLLPAAPSLGGFDAAAVPGHIWALGAFIVVFPTALAYLLNYWALARVESSLVAFFIYLQPLIATSLSILLLDESLDGWMVAGALLIFAAVWLALRRRG